MRRPTYLSLLGLVCVSNCASGAQDANTVDLRALGWMPIEGRFVLRRETEWDREWDYDYAERISWDAVEKLLRDESESPEAEFQYDDETLTWNSTTPLDAPARALLDAIVADATADPPLELWVVKGVFDEHLRLVPREDWEEADAALERDGHEVLRVSSLSLPSQGIASAHQESSEPLTLDWEIEVSHSTVVHDPRTQPYPRGLRMEARASRATGGALLDLGFVFTEPARETRSRTLEPKVWMASCIPHEFDGQDESGAFAEILEQLALKPFLYHDTLPLRVDTPLDRSAAFTTSLFLADDAALWIPITARGREGELAYTVIVRRPRASADWVRELPPSKDGRERVLVHAASAVHEGFLRPRIEEDDAEYLAPFDPFRATSIRQFASPDPTAAMESIADRLHEIGRPAEEDDAAKAHPQITELGYDTFLVEASSADGAALAANVRDCGVVPRTATLRVVVRDGDRVIADTELPTLVDTWTTLRVGLDQMRLVDWDAEVANDVACGNPDHVPFLDGTALDLRVTEATARACEIEVSGLVLALTEPLSDLETGSPYTPAIDQARSHRRLLEDVLVVPLEGGVGRATIVGSPISVEITVGLGEWVEDEDESATGHESRRVEFYDLFGWSAFEDPGAPGDEVSRTGPLGDPRRIEVRLLRGRAPSEGAELLSVAEADRRIAALGKDAVTHLASVPLWRGTDATTEQFDSSWLVSDFETELAHGAVSYDPIPAERRSGLRATFTPEADDGNGVRLHWHLRGLASGPERLLHLAPRPLMASPFPVEPVVLNGPVPLVVDTFVTPFLVANGTVQIPDGCACWLRGRVDTVFGPTEMSFDVRVVGERPKDLEPYRDAPWIDEREVDFGNWGEPLYGSPYTYQRYESEFDPTLAFSTTNYRVTATISHDGAPLATLSTITSEGSIARLAAGALFLSLTDWDVDTAGEAAIGNPEMMPELDGAVLRLLVASSGQDAVQVSLYGELRHPRALPVLTDLGNPRTPVVERTTTDTLELDRSERLVLDDEGRTTLTVPGKPFAVVLRIERLGEEL